MQRAFKLTLVILVIAASGAAFYFYRQAADLKENPQAAATKEAEKLVAEISELMILPVGETPTVATVSDPQKLKDRPFFANAKTGDKLLIFAKAKKAILYDPDAKKIIEVSPIDLGGSPAVGIEP